MAGTKGVPGASPVSPVANKRRKFPQFPQCSREQQLPKEERDLLYAMADARSRFTPNQTLRFVLSVADVMEAATGHYFVCEEAAERILEELGVVVPTGRWYYRDDR